MSVKIETKLDWLKEVVTVNSKKYKLNTLGRALMFIPVLFAGLSTLCLLVPALVCIGLAVGAAVGIAWLCGKEINPQDTK